MWEHMHASFYYLFQNLLFQSFWVMKTSSRKFYSSIWLFGYLNIIQLKYYYVTTVSSTLKLQKWIKMNHSFKTCYATGKETNRKPFSFHLKGGSKDKTRSPKIRTTYSSKGHMDFSSLGFTVCEN